MKRGKIMNCIPKILVLLTTYNGEKYIKEQIESIINQKDVSVDIFVSDDSSTDSSYSILKEYEKQGKIKLIRSKCGSAQKNFYNLINLASEEYDYYALSDQDDYWLEDKLTIAVNSLSKYKSTYPLLYSGTSIPVDENLNVIKKREYKHHLVNTVEEAFIASNSQGCTMVFNKCFLKLIKSKETKTSIMHDAWLHKTCIIVGGKIIFDNIPHMYYRQHNNNVYSTLKKETKTERILKKIKFIFGNEQAEMRSKLIYEWKGNFNNDLTTEAKKVFDELIATKTSLCKRIKVIFSKRYRSKYRISYLKFIILVLRGKI